MQTAKPGEFRILQAGNGAEDAHLLAVFQFGLETDHVEQRAKFVVLA